MKKLLVDVRVAVHEPASYLCFCQWCANVFMQEAVGDAAYPCCPQLLTYVVPSCVLLDDKTGLKQTAGLVMSRSLVNTDIIRKSLRNGWVSQPRKLLGVIYCNSYA